ncbi:hypothetical protein HPB48_004146 [Haemaphysalis longicornis]|uniref:EGF-like domain-containing protein n=1 Tax=Haemaphysalis longicornis TaxID=44386 RepID=A0A9J6FMY4_HAELO|nr:hypothetical protein HPB48_004146 [Haemaphysalis longicornis]
MTNGSCEPVDCLDDAECSEDNMRCIGRRCRCASDFDLVENKCRKSKVGECREQLDCFLNHSTCLADEGRCVCAEGFRAVFMAGSADRACLRVSCSTDSDCEATSAGATCVRGLCVCPDDQPPQSAFCLLPQPNRFESQGVLGVTKLVTYCLGLVIGVGAFAAVLVTLLRAKASAGYEPSCPDVDDEEAAKRLDEEGAIMAAVAALRDRYVLEDGQEFEESAEAYAGDMADDMYSEEERRIDRMFVRSVFPKRSDGLFVSTHGINRGSSSSGAAVAPSSRTTVDI